MAARIALVLSAAFLCLVLGLVSAPAAPAVVVPAHPLRLADLRLDPAGEAAASAAAALAGAAPPAPSAPSAAAPRTPRPVLAPAPPPPPPPGPEAVLRSSVAAVTEDHGRLGLVLAGGGRRLGVGEAFMGWTVASVSRTGAVLRRGGARREVSFFAPGASRGGASSPPPYGAAPGAPQYLPEARRPSQAAPTAAEYFRGFKG